MSHLQVLMHTRRHFIQVEILDQSGPRAFSYKIDKSLFFFFFFFFFFLYFLFFFFFFLFIFFFFLQNIAFLSSTYLCTLCMFSCTHADILFKSKFLTSRALVLFLSFFF